MILSDLIDRGVRVDEYLTRNTVRLDSAISKFMAAAKNFAAEIEREKTAQRTHEALKTKARKGLNVGGRCFGYDNQEGLRGREARSDRVQRQRGPGGNRSVNLPGLRFGLGPQAHRSGLERPAPSVAAGRLARDRLMVPVGHPPASKRERYRGVLAWGEFEKTYALGTKVRVRRAVDDVDRVRVEVAELRIVEDDLGSQCRLDSLVEARAQSVAGVFHATCCQASDAARRVAVRSSRAAASRGRSPSTSTSAATTSSEAQRSARTPCGAPRQSERAGDWLDPGGTDPGLVFRVVSEAPARCAAYPGHPKVSDTCRPRTGAHRSKEALLMPCAADGASDAPSLAACWGAEVVSPAPGQEHERDPECNHRSHSHSARPGRMAADASARRSTVGLKHVSGTALASRAPLARRGPVGRLGRSWPPRTDRRRQVQARTPWREPSTPRLNRSTVDEGAAASHATPRWRRQRRRLPCQRRRPQRPLLRHAPEAVEAWSGRKCRVARDRADADACGGRHVFRAATSTKTETRAPFMSTRAPVAACAIVVRPPPQP